MAKLLIVFGLFIASVAARNVEFHKDGKNEFHQNFGLGLEHQQPEDFGELIEGWYKGFADLQKGLKDDRRSSGHKGDNGGHEGQPHKHHFPPFFGNVTAEAIKELLKILLNRSLTKEELLTQIEKWATAQGPEVAEKFNQLKEAIDTFKKTMRTKMSEILSDVTSFISEISAVKDDLNITRDQEREKLKVIFDQQPLPVIKIAKMVKDVAKKEALRSLLQPSTPAFPVVDSTSSSV